LSDLAHVALADLDNEFLTAMPAFGRLEATVKLAIRTLAVSMRISCDFTAGIARAEKQCKFGKMCR
jgi:hypothetical protein